jgi:hypothetical protein
MIPQKPGDARFFPTLYPYTLPVLADYLPQLAVSDRRFPSIAKSALTPHDARIGLNNDHIGLVQHLRPAGNLRLAQALLTQKVVPHLILARADDAVHRFL